MKLNLGSGSKILKGYVNVDKFQYYNPDVVHDLEKFPYPFENNSVDEILLSHVLEHIGQNPEIFGLFGLSSRTPFKGLWLCGDSIYPGEGTAGVSQSALMVSRQILASRGINNLNL